MQRTGRGVSLPRFHLRKSPMFAHILRRLIIWVPSVMLVMLGVYALAFYGAGDPIKLIFLRAPGRCGL